jgi:hypothetical protein
MFHQHPSHGRSDDPEEVGAAAPVDRDTADQAQVGLIHKGGGLQRVVGSLVPQEGGGQAAQLLVRHLEQALGGGSLVPLLPGQDPQDPRDLSFG